MRAGGGYKGQCQPNDQYPELDEGFRELLRHQCCEFSFDFFRSLLHQSPIPVGNYLWDPPRLYSFEFKYLIS
jgi:hypothetical protein